MTIQLAHFGSDSAELVSTSGRLQRTRSVTRGGNAVLTALLVTFTMLATVSPAAAEVTITEHSLPNAASTPTGITSGPDGNLWFTGYAGNRIGKITTSRTITEYTIPTAASSPNAITAGPDGNLWFVEYTGNKIGKITTSGTITEYALPTLLSIPVGITDGPDGNLWFTEYAGNKIGTITTMATTSATSPHH